MRAAEQRIAKKYAKALLNVYFPVIKPTCFDTLVELSSFFKNHKKFMRYLCIPTIPDSIKEHMLDKVLESLHVCSTVKTLITPLMKQRRIELLDQIIVQLIEGYQANVGVVGFEVFTSHQLPAEEQESIISFLTRETGATVEAQFLVDKTLIAGFRAQSRTFLFEHSLIKKIRDVKTSFYQRIES